MPLVELRFNQTMIKALIDTSAQISVITKATYDKLVQEMEKMDVVLIRKFIIREAFSEKDAVIANKV